MSRERVTVDKSTQGRKKGKGRKDTSEGRPEVRVMRRQPQGGRKGEVSRERVTVDETLMRANSEYRVNTEVVVGGAGQK